MLLVIHSYPMRRCAIACIECSGLLRFGLAVGLLQPYWNGCDDLD